MRLYLFLLPVRPDRAWPQIARAESLHTILERSKASEVHMETGTWSMHLLVFRILASFWQWGHGIRTAGAPLGNDARLGSIPQTLGIRPEKEQEQLTLRYKLKSA